MLSHDQQCAPYATKLNYRNAAVWVDKILEEAKSADLPTQQPTRLELVVSMRTAKAMGFTIPQSILLRADRVIE